MQVIKNENGELWIVQEGFVIPEGERELDIDEATQKSYLLDVLGSFSVENTKILNNLVNNPQSIRSYADEAVLSDGQSVYLPGDVEAISRWRQRLGNNSNVPITSIIERVEDIEELKTLLRAVANMPGYNLLKIGFIEQITDAIISQTKKQLRVRDVQG